MPTRRTFLSTAAVLATPSLLRAATLQRHRAVIIGATGKGDYGHGLDLIFDNLPNVELIALADPDEHVRANAQAHTSPKRTHADYREMPDNEKHTLVSNAPRWTDQHH